MDITAQTYSDSELKDLLAQFDFSKINSYTSQEITDFGNKLLLSNDQELKDVGNELLTIDPMVFELNAAEAMLKRLLSFLEKHDYPEEVRSKIALEIVQSSVDNAMGKVLAAMSEETHDKWVQLEAFSPNIFQKMLLLNDTAKMLLDTSIDELYQASMIKAIKLALSIFKNTEASTKLMMQLKPEQIANVKGAFDNSQYEMGIQLIFKYVDENGNSKSDK
jgi:hypothetical protein